MVLAAIALKLGAYGFLRFSLPIAPGRQPGHGAVHHHPVADRGGHIGFVALVQTDMKKLVAYSSIAHMGFIALGFPRSSSALGIEGALVQMISHGFISGAMFLCIGVLYDRMHSRNIADYGGVVNPCPSSPRSSCSSRWPTPACRHLRLHRRVHGGPGAIQVQLLWSPLPPRPR